MKRLAVLFAVVFVLGIGSSSEAFFLNFENGTDRGPVTGITGITLQDFNGYNPIYGDTRTRLYNTHSDDLNIGSGIYHHNGNFFVWAGENADARGVKVDFVNNDGTWFQTGYSAYSIFYLDAYLTDGSVVSVTGAANVYQPMGYLLVNAPDGKYIDYVVLHDTGNYWIVDDMSGNASGIPTQTPEPLSLLLVGLGLMGLAGSRRYVK